MANKEKWRELVEYAWTGLNESELVDWISPFDLMTQDDKENPDLYLLSLMRRPENFAFTAKILFDIDLLPYQCVIIQEMWKRPFPILLGSRGLGKTFCLALYAILRATFLQGRKIVMVAAGFRQSKNFMSYVEDLWYKSAILQDIMSGSPLPSGPRHDTDRWTMRVGYSTITALPLGDGCLVGDTNITYNNGFGTIKDDVVNNINYRNRLVLSDNGFINSDEAYNNGIKQTIKLTTKKGFTLEGTINHRIKDNNFDWKRLDEIKLGNKIPINKINTWHAGSFDCSINDAYVLGLMIGDGSFTRDNVFGFSTKDKEFIPCLNTAFDKQWVESKDKVHYRVCGKSICKKWLSFWGLNCTKTIDKKLPKTILCAEQDKMSACLRGIFDTDGTIQIGRKDNGYGITISLTNTSKILMEQIQYVLLHYGIVANLKFRDRNVKWNRVYELYITGKDTLIFSNKIGFGLKRKQDKLDDAIKNKKKWVNFRNEDDNYFYDTVTKIEYSKANTYDIHVPNTHTYIANGFISHNSRIRGERANDTIIDEFSAIQNVDIIERVIGGFSVVSSSPAEKVKHGARIEKMKELGLLSEERANQTESFRIKNQQIISGTAYYSFNHFAKYHAKWKKIIESKGDLSKLQEVFTNEEGLVEIPDGFDWRDYSVIRIPVTLLPKHYMDMAQVARARATMDTGIYSMEYLTLHSDDSKGFFRASLINSCVANPENIERWKQFGMDNMKFVGALRGKQGYKYVMGVDTASERDNFAIVILELHENHRRIVHCWTFNRAKHKKLVEEGLCQETDFYGYGARKIRELMEAFPVEFIAMDFQGGGLSVSEALHSVHNMKEGEQPIWPIIKEDEEQDTDNYPGLHIIEPIQFANSQWTKEANHGMKKDFEDKKLIFPMFDSVALIEVQEGLYDTTEECMMEIEEIKNELITIVHTQTPNGTERWDTPEIKLSGSKKGRQLKDRYSALLMANAVARNIDGIKPRPLYTDGLGGFVGGRTKGQVGPMYSGPEWFTKQINENNYGFVGSV